MQIVTRIFKRLIYVFTIMYSFNVLVSSFGMNVPVNLYSLGFVYSTGIPGIISLVIVKFLIK